MSSFILESQRSGPAVLIEFLDRAGLSRSPQGELREQNLSGLAEAFSHLPYENLTKIIRANEMDNLDQARRSPAEVVQDHWRYGTGGTCFSLTWTLLTMVRAMGWQAQPILADRRYGPDTHCALMMEIDGRPHLLDPGYLLVHPIPLPEEEAIVPTSFNRIILTPQGEGKMALATLDESKSIHRLTYKTEPIDDGQFIRAWDASFGWEMMSYPVLSRVVEGRQLYLQRNHLLSRDLNSSTRIEVDPHDLAAAISRDFGIAPALVARALSLVGNK
jgi:arylamine N-acetyltransferase